MQQLSHRKLNWITIPKFLLRLGFRIVVLAVFLVGTAIDTFIWVGYDAKQERRARRRRRNRK